MWLTGFDAPSLHTMYVDKPMQSAGLMQTIARVNRRFKDKPGGLIVDYIGLFQSLQDALAVYSPWPKPMHWWHPDQKQKRSVMTSDCSPTCGQPC